MADFCEPECAVNIDESVRPHSLEDFIGQDDLRANLRVFLDAARERGKQLAAAARGDA